MGSSKRRPSKILLPNLGTESLNLPSPHLSNPILPPIKAKPRNHAGDDVKHAVPRPKPLTDSLKDLGSNDSGNSCGRSESVASFPSHGVSIGQLELQRELEECDRRQQKLAEEHREDMDILNSQQPMEPDAGNNNKQK